MKTYAWLFLGAAGIFASAQSHAVDCTSLPQYVNGSTYATGAVVKNIGNAYRCDVGGWCSVGGPYEPGVGWAAANAWTGLGACTATSSTPSSKSSVSSASSKSSTSSISSASSKSSVASSIASSVISSISSSTANNCPSLTEWSATATYTKDMQVVYKGIKYQAKWWTQNEDPSTHSSASDVWINLGPCAGSSASSASSKSSASSVSSTSTSASSKSSVSSSSVAGGHRYVAYAGTWLTSIYDLKTANIPNYITNLHLSFVRPDTTYQKGSYAFDQSVAGFEFAEGAATNNGQRVFSAQQAQDLRNIITALRNRGTQVWISVGGWSYSQGDQWTRFNAPRIVALAQDLGASGVDIDWESSTSACNKLDDANFSCSKDAEIENIITSLYNENLARGAGLGISIAGWSTGAYYVKGTQFEEGKVQWGSPFGGTLYNLVKRQGSKLTYINLMSYDAGDYYDPREGYLSYRAIYNGPINMGMEIAPEGAGGSVLKINAPAGTVYDADILTGQNNMATQYYNVETLVKYIKNKGRANDGFMFWQLWKQRVNAVAPAGAATENSAGQYVCANLPLAGDCSQTIPTLPVAQ
jgi:chitodextrinase